MQIAIAVTIGMMIGAFLGMLLMCVLTSGKNAELDSEVVKQKRINKELADFCKSRGEAMDELRRKLDERC